MKNHLTFGWKNFKCVQVGSTFDFCFPLYLRTSLRKKMSVLFHFFVFLSSPYSLSLKISKLKLKIVDWFERLKFINFFFYLSSFCWKVRIIMNIYCNYFPLHLCQTTAIYVSLNLPGNIKWFVHDYIITLFLWFFLTTTAGCMHC